MNGEIEIMVGFDRNEPFAVCVWDRHRDAGYIAKCFATRQRAIDFAEGMVEASDLSFYSAEVVALREGAQ